MSRGKSRGRGDRLITASNKERTKGAAIGGSRSNPLLIDTDKVKKIISLFEPSNQAREPANNLVDETQNHSDDGQPKSVGKVVGKRLEFNAIANLRQTHNTVIGSPFSPRSSSYPLIAREKSSTASPNHPDSVRRNLLSRLTLNSDKTPSTSLDDNNDFNRFASDDDDNEAELLNIRSTSSLTGIKAGVVVESPLPPLRSLSTPVVKKKYHECNKKYASSKQKKDILDLCNKEFNQLLLKYGI
jgi:hypothetical protein